MRCQTDGEAVVGRVEGALALEVDQGALACALVVDFLMLIPREEATQMRTSQQDPAESGYLRYFYRDWRPTRFGRIWNGAYAWLSGLALTPELLVTLQVKSRRDGRLGSTILVGAEHEGRRYVVSMLGEGSEWVKNLRAAGGAAIIKRGSSRPVVLSEIPPAERAPILKTWARVATSGRKHLPVPHDAPLAAFEAIAADYPVFRIDEAM